MRSMLARIVLALASLPAFDATADAEVLVLESPATEQTGALERRLVREVQRHLALSDGTACEGTLVVNLRIAPDGHLDVVNAHGGTAAQRAEVVRCVGRMNVG